MGLKTRRPTNDLDTPAHRLTWAEISSADPDLILLSPCGFTLDRSRIELDQLAATPEWSSLRAVRGGNVALVDGSAYFSRPGPRLHDSLQIAGEMISGKPSREGFEWWPERLERIH